MKKTNLMKTLGLMTVPVLALGVVALTVPDAAAQVDAGVGATGQTQQSNANVNDIVEWVVNAMLFAIGAASVVMLIYGGIRYTVSGGNQDHVRTAKNTIMYALIGLVVAILAYAIVHWVLDIFN